MESLSYYSGKFVPTSECSIPVTDLALRRGAGVFESVRVYDGSPFALGQHMDRLGNSARTAGMRIGDMVETIRSVIAEGVKREDCPKAPDSFAKAYITGGDELENGLFPSPRFFVTFDMAFPVTREEFMRGVSLKTAMEPRLHPSMKSINYLFGIMAMANSQGINECLYCPDGKITEAMTSSFFLCRDGIIITAPEKTVLGGVTRGIVLELARENGFTVEERCADVDELERADEAFITASSKEVLPVLKVDGRPIGSGRPGVVATHLSKLFKANIGRWIEA